MTDTAAEREILAARVLDEAPARAAKVANAGARSILLRAADVRAERVLAGLPVDMSYLRARAAPAQRRESRAAPVPRDLRGADGAAKPITVRPCLRCRSPFDSHGPGNRLCPACRARSADASPYAV